MSDGNYTSRDRRTFIVAFLAGVALVVGYGIYTLWPSAPPELDPVVIGDAPKVEITVEGESNGVIEITLRPDLAPEHVERIITLANEGAYDNVVFHRVIDGFMAQTGDVEFGKADGNGGRAGMGGSSYPPRSEGRVHGRALSGWNRGHGALAKPELGQQSVLHHVRPRRFPEREIHGRRSCDRWL